MDRIAIWGLAALMLCSAAFGGLDSPPLGDSAVTLSLSLPSLGGDAGFPTGYPLPGEVTGLLFRDKVSLHWDPEESVGVYNLYRDLVSNLTAPGFDGCEQQDLPSTMATDSTAVPAGDGYFYLVTAENPFGGTPERANSPPCP